MPDSIASAKTKPKVWKVVEKEVGTLTMPNARRRDWRVTSDGRTSIFLTYSKYYESSDCWWYGLAPEDLREWRSYGRVFVVFVVDDEKETLVVPVEELAAQVRKSRLTLDKTTGHFKLHLIPATRKYRFRELPGFDLSTYHRNYRLLCSS